MADRMIFELIRTMLLTGQRAGILADYLEEQGHPLAEEVRFDPRKKAKGIYEEPSKLAIIAMLVGRGLSLLDVLALPLAKQTSLQLVLSSGLLPTKVLGLLACDFAEHVVPHYRLTNIHLDHHRLRRALDTRRQRWQGTIEPEAYETTQRQNLMAIQDRIYSLRREQEQRKAGPDHNLAILVMQTIEKALEETPSALETAIKAVDATAHVFGQAGRRRQRNSLPWKEERWQVRRTREVIQSLPAET